MEVGGARGENDRRGSGCEVSHTRLQVRKQLLTLCREIDGMDVNEVYSVLFSHVEVNAQMPV